MKKYLSKNIFNIKNLAILSILGIIFSFSYSFAQSKIEYYKKLFGEEYNFKIFEEDKEKSSKKGYLSTNPSKGYLILLSSSIPTTVDEDLDQEETKAGLEEYLLEYKKIIVICDNSYTEEGIFNFSCDKTVVQSPDFNIIGKFLKSDEDDLFDLYVIPENLLVSPDKREEIEKYFKAFSRSDEAPFITEDAETVGEVKTKIDILKEFQKTTTFETFIIALSMISIVVVSYRLLRIASGDKRKNIEFEEKENLFSNILKFFTPHKWVLVYALILMFFIYIPMVIILGVKDGKGLDIGYLINYSLDTFKIRNLINYISVGENFRVAVFLYNFIFLILLSACFIPSIINIILIGSYKIVNSKIKPEVIRYLTPAIVVLALISTSFFEISSSYRFLILLLVLLSFISLNNLKNNTFEYNYSSREKMVIISIAALIFLGGFLLKLREQEVGIEYKYEDLIGVPDEVITLPYSKEFGDGVLFNEYSTLLTEPVFVNNYLVYSPVHSRIENKNAKEFVNSGSFYIQNGSLKDIVSAIYSNDGLSLILMTKIPSNFFRVRNFDKSTMDEDPKIQITFSCVREELDTDKIKADFYYFSEDGEVEDSNQTLLYFQGCSKVGEPETFTVDFDPPYIESDYFFMRLRDVLGSDLEDIKIVTSDSVIIPTFYSKGSGYQIIDSGGLEKSSRGKITNYIFGESYNLSFDLELDPEDGFDISEPINELVREEILKNRFLIWSTKKYLPIRFPD